MITSIIPRPNNMKTTKGTFLLDGPVSISSAQTKDQSLLMEVLTAETGLYPSDNNEQNIVLQYHDDMVHEQYDLIISDSRIELSAGDESGMFYGLMTLKQLMHTNSQLKGIIINDFPAHRHRGFMVDVGRHFIPVDEIKRMLDLAALHKMNKFHWHLSEDQGFRIEIKKYPRLTSHGSKRAGSFAENKGFYRDFDNNGFYTQEEVKEVVRYASQLHIDIIPEIDIPGHTAAMVSAYPELSCTGEDIDVRIEPGIYKDTLCAGNDHVYDFVYNIIDELVELFPYDKFHVGGDEVNKGNWIKCKKCLALAKEQGMTKASQLHTYFNRKVVNYLSSKGKTAILWNDAFLEDFDMDEVMCQFWMSFKEDKELTNVKGKNISIINSDFFSYYFDYPYAMTSLKKTYTNEVESLKDYQLEGYECPMWTEMVASRERFNYLMYPRMFAVAEVAWTYAEERNYNDFESSLYAFEQLYNRYGLNLESSNIYNVGGLKAKIEIFNHFRKAIFTLLRADFRIHFKSSKVRFDQTYFDKYL